MHGWDGIPSREAGLNEITDYLYKWEPVTGKTKPGIGKTR
jgi:hypothetical protein